MMDHADVLGELDQLRSRYEVLRRLGRDGASIVYAVRGRTSDRHYAVKVMSDSGARSARPDALHVWHAHTVQPLVHPKVMTLHAVHHLQGGAVAIAMDRRRGRTLAERLEADGPMAPEEVARVLRDIAEALAYLHGRGVVHRGVRPGSIFLDRDSGCARLAHFAIDRVGDERSVADAQVAAARPFAYLAPEQIDGNARVDDRGVSARSDLYSLGLVGYAMLTGRQPWEGKSVASVVDGRRTGSLPPIADVRPDVPPNLCRVLERCLGDNPRRRWSSANALLAALGPAAGHDRRTAPTRPSGLWRALLDGAGAIRDAAGARAANPTWREITFAAACALIVVGIAATVLRGDDPPDARADADRGATVGALPPPVSPEYVPDDAGGSLASPMETRSDAVPARTEPSSGTPAEASRPAPLPVSRAAPRSAEAPPGARRSEAPATPAPPPAAPRRAPRSAPSNGMHFVGEPDLPGVVLLGEPIDRRGEPRLLGEPARTAARSP